MSSDMSEPPETPNDSLILFRMFSSLGLIAVGITGLFTTFDFKNPIGLIASAIAFGVLRLTYNR
jgi:hypothetical protein